MKRRTVASIPALAALAPALFGASTSAATGGAAPLEPRPPVDPPIESPSILEGNLPAFYERLKAELRYPLAWGNAPVRDLRAWRRLARATVEELLCQPPDDMPLRPQIVEEVPAEGYVQRRLLFNVTQHSRVRATMLMPDGRGPFPGVLLLHDHGSKFDIGKEKLIRPWYDETRLASAQAWSTRYFSDRFVGNELAVRGYAVLAVDALGWGDRAGITYETQQALASNFYNLGSSLAGLVAREDTRAAALLAQLPGVDRRRIAAVGFSMGAYRAWQVAALSDDVAAAASICWMTTLKDMMVPGNNTLRGQSAYYMLHPGLYRYLDIPDVASIAAPKPGLFFDGELDPLFTPAGVDGAYARMRTVWESQRAGDRLTTKVWPGLGHVFVREMQDEVYAWLDRVLKRR
jgi:dienelactone hydrolase